MELEAVPRYWYEDSLLKRYSCPVLLVFLLSLNSWMLALLMG